MRSTRKNEVGGESLCSHLQKPHKNPFIFGGAQERGLRAGTEALPNILGMEKAITISYKNLIKEKKYIQSLKDYFIKSIDEAKTILKS